MSTMGLAMLLLQEGDAEGTRHLVLIFIIIVSIVLSVMAVVMIFIGLKALKVVRELGVMAAEAKVKFLPLMDEVMAISKTSRMMLDDAAPKIKTISENLRKTSETLVEASGVAKSSVMNVHGTILDANARTQRQVARVDSMVSAALTTTQEVADTVANGIRVPAMKIASMLHQARLMGEGMMAKFKAKTTTSAVDRDLWPE